MQLMGQLPEVRVNPSKPLPILEFNMLDTYVKQGGNEAKQ